MVTIRSARRSDAAHVAVLMDIAGHGIEAEFWARQPDGDHSALAAARRLVIEDRTLPYHLSRVSVLEVDNEVAGAVIGGLVEEQPVVTAGFPDHFAPLLELESRVAGYWTVVGLALYPEFRGRGLARRLLAHAEDLARQAGAKGMSIVVEDSNLRAIALYRAVGFRDRETRPWRPYGGRSGPLHWVLLDRRF